MIGGFAKKISVGFTAVVNNVKKHLPYYIYGVLGLCTLIIAVTMLSWSLAGTTVRAIEMHAAALVGSDEARTEYLVGQQLDTSGLQLNIGTDAQPNNIDLKDCTVAADFTSAGEKTVEIVYMADQYTGYSATFNVNVLFVRSAYIESYPAYIEVSQDGTAKLGSGFVAWAELATAAETDVFGEAEITENGCRIRLTDDTYTVSCVGSAVLSGYYSMTVFCGNVQMAFNVYNAAERSFIVSSAGDVVKYTSDNAESAAEMTLVVTDRDENYQVDCVGETEGAYIYRDALGAESVLPFAYALTDTEEQLKSPVEADGFAEQATDGQYSVTYGGERFTAQADIFQSAVVGGTVVDDHGYKLVVDSDKRILRFTYDPADRTDPTDPDYDASASNESATEEGAAPSLTLYVTDYDMNPLLGTGNGWSRGVYIYTDTSGNSHKILFYLQAFVWTYVPNSGASGDVYDDVTVNDFVYNHEAPDDSKWNSYHRGTLYATVSQYDRGNGFIHQRFSVPDIVAADGSVLTPSEDQWLPAIMGM